jgi:hypothetical protein
VLDAPPGFGLPDGSNLLLLTRFVMDAGACLRRFHLPAPTTEIELHALARLATVHVLQTLNALVNAFEKDLAECQASEAAEKRNAREFISTTLGDIERLGTRINIVAQNAVIEAARAGPAGRAFAVIASEMQTLNVTARQEASKIGGVVETLFARG